MTNIYIYIYIYTYLFSKFYFRPGPPPRRLPNWPETAAPGPPDIVEWSSEIVGFQGRGMGPPGHPQGVRIEPLRSGLSEATKHIYIYIYIYIYFVFDFLIPARTPPGGSQIGRKRRPRISSNGPRKSLVLVSRSNR